MSNRARDLRRARAWARYYNHYAFMLMVQVGGWAAVRAINVPGKQWPIVRRQAKRKFKPAGVAR